MTRQPEVDAVQARPSTPILPPPKLVPQPEGTPLPPRDPRIAERWPPEIKQLVDNMLGLFPKEGRPPNETEVAKKMGIVLTETPLTPEERIYVSKRYAISGTRYATHYSNVANRSDLDDRYYVDSGRDRKGDRRQILTLVTSPPQSGYCLNPYEFAVYTGGTFVNGDISAHTTLRDGLRNPFRRAI